MGFWDNKIGGGGQAPPPTRQTPYAGVLPDGMGTNHDRAVDHYVETQTPNGIPQGFEPPPNFEIPVPGDPHSYHKKMWGWKGNPRGGAGETATTGSCPECGSPRFFSRSTEKIMNHNTGMSYAPAPKCFDCGYPNKQGELSASVITQGVNRARGDEAPPPPGSLAHLRQTG